MGTYIVKDIFGTLQGEGVNSGRKAVFLRLSAGYHIVWATLR